MPISSSITSGLVAGIRSLGVTLGVAICEADYFHFQDHTLTTRTDTAIFYSRISKLLPKMVSEAALQNGLPEESVPALILALSAGDTAQLTKIPGITAEIIGAAAHAFKTAYLNSFQSVWIAVTCLSACGLIGKLPI